MGDSSKGLERLLTDGNKNFKSGDFEQAIKNYSEAIALCPTDIGCLMCRVRCYFKLGDYLTVEKECESIIMLDRQNIEAYHYLGVAVLSKGEYMKGFKHLEAAMDLARKVCDLDRWKRIRKDHAKGRFEEWCVENKKRLGQFQSLKESFENAVKENNSLHSLKEGDLNTLRKLFDEAVNAEQMGDIPKHLICPISLSIFRDPVLTVDGLTYERERGDFETSRAERAGPIDKDKKQ